jgi:hypothetical protein
MPHEAQIAIGKAIAVDLKDPIQKQKLLTAIQVLEANGKKRVVDLTDPIQRKK